jgi:hypothetical protein
MSSTNDRSQRILAAVLAVPWVVAGTFPFWAPGLDIPELLSIAADDARMSAVLGLGLLLAVISPAALRGSGAIRTVFVVAAVSQSLLVAQYSISRAYAVVPAELGRVAEYEFWDAATVIAIPSVVAFLATLVLAFVGPTAAPDQPRLRAAPATVGAICLALLFLTTCAGVRVNGTNFAWVFYLYFSVLAVALFHRAPADRSFDAGVAVLLFALHFEMLDLWYAEQCLGFHCYNGVPRTSEELATSSFRHSWAVLIIGVAGLPLVVEAARAIGWRRKVAAIALVVTALIAIQARNPLPFQARYVTWE